jgi:hypothetical protein
MVGKRKAKQPGSSGSTHASHTHRQYTRTTHAPPHLLPPAVHHVKRLCRGAAVGRDALAVYGGLKSELGYPLGTLGRARVGAQAAVDLSVLCVG